MKIFLTSDLHFDHFNVIKYCNRPFKKVSEMNLKLIENWNKVVSPDDTVFVLGDLAMTRNREKVDAWVKALNGTKHLILGNHDELKVWDYVSAGFASVHTSYQLDKNIYLAHDPAVKTALPKDSILLHGHVHQLWKVKKDNNLVNVGVDVWDFKPVLLEDCLKTLQTEETSPIEVVSSAAMEPDQAVLIDMSVPGHAIFIKNIGE